MKQTQNLSPLPTDDKTPRPDAEQIGQELRSLGAEVKVHGSLIVAVHEGKTVTIRLCRENIPFIWWTAEDGDDRISYQVGDAKRALGVG